VLNVSAADVLMESILRQERSRYIVTGRRNVMVSFAIYCDRKEERMGKFCDIL
jgi:hypothetical protein